MKPRDANRAALIQKSWQDVQSQLDAEGNFTEESFQKLFAKK